VVELFVITYIKHKTLNMQGDSTMGWIILFCIGIFIFNLLTSNITSSSCGQYDYECMDISEREPRPANR